MTNSWVLVLLVPAALLVNWLLTRAKHMKIEADKLRQAARWVDQHTLSLEEFLDHPRVTVELKKLALDMSDSYQDPKLMMRVAEFVVDENAGLPAIEDHVEILERLRTEDQELYQLFLKTNVHGMLAGLFRFRENWPVVEAVAARLAADPSKDISIVAATLPPPSYIRGIPSYA